VARPNFAIAVFNRQGIDGYLTLTLSACVSRNEDDIALVNNIDIRIAELA
jgi:hypothetical protein